MTKNIKINIENYSNLLDSSKEHLSNQAIATYQNFNELLNLKEKKFIERHIENCSECKSRFAAINLEDLEMDIILNTWEISKAQKKKSKIFSLRTKIKYSIAAAIFIGILIIVNNIFLKKKTVNKTIPVVHNIDSIKILKDSINVPFSVEEQIDRARGITVGEDDFAENNILENFIDRNIRSEKTVEIISPAINANVKSKIKFEWKKIVNVGWLKLTIVDNRNNTIYDIVVEGNKLTIDSKFKPGLYYWKLSSNNKLYTVGKFYVLEH